MAQVSSINAQLKSLEAQLEALQQEIREFQLLIPNLLHESVPVGLSEDDNV